MKDVRVGDVVQTSDATFERVYSFGHLDEMISAEFIMLSFATDDSDSDSKQDSLELTGNHLVYIEGEKNPVRADTIRIGDILKSASAQIIGLTVTKIHNSVNQGLYMPLTSSGTIVVNGVISSCYVSLKEEMSEESLRSAVWFLSENSLLHLWLSPYRMLCLGVSSVFGDVHGDKRNYLNEEGKHWWLLFGKYIGDVAGEWSAFARVLFIGMPLLVVFGIMNLAEIVLGVLLQPALLLVLVAGCLAARSVRLVVGTKRDNSKMV